jgi:putative membrane protein
MIGTQELLIIFVILIIGIICLIYYLINRNKTCGSEGKSALDIAKERYAKGEITKEEFEELKKNLI